MSRPKGSTNHTTIAFRESVQRLLDYAAPQMVDWLQRVADEDGPLKALGIVKDLAEYAAPKLQRTEHTGDGGGPVQQSITVEFVGKSSADSDSR